MVPVINMESQVICLRMIVYQHIPEVLPANFWSLIIHLKVVLKDKRLKRDHVLVLDNYRKEIRTPILSM